jgi:hypothetical protein
VFFDFEDTKEALDMPSKHPSGGGCGGGGIGICRVTPADDQDPWAVFFPLLFCISRYRKVSQMLETEIDCVWFFCEVSSDSVGE